MRKLFLALLFGALGCVAHGGKGTTPHTQANAPHVVRGSEDFALQMTNRAGDGRYRPELRIAVEVAGAGGVPIWVRVEKDGYTVGQAPVKGGIATMADTGIPLEGSLGDGWYKVIVEEIVEDQRYPIAWYNLPLATVDSTGGRILTIHPSYYRKHADLRDSTLRFVTSAGLEQPYTQIATEWVYAGRLVGEVARRWEMPSLWILQPLNFPVRVQLRSPYQLVDGEWDVIVFRDGNYEMHCPFSVRGGKPPGRLECASDDTPLLPEARARASRHELVAPDAERASQVRALVKSPEVRRALVKEDQHDHYLELVKKYGAVQASSPAQP
jgi:hypothetical protein